MVATWMGEVWCHRRALGMGLELRLYNRVSERVCVNPVMRRSVDVRARERRAYVCLLCVYRIWCALKQCVRRTSLFSSVYGSTLVSTALEGSREIITFPAQG